MVVVVDALSRHARGTLITALLLVLRVGYAQRREAGTHALQTCPNVATKQFIHRHRMESWQQPTELHHAMKLGKENLYNYLCQQVFRKHTDSSHSNSIDKTY